ncbi:ATP-binding protein [Roseovarius aestuarii]|nr:ATP-binding protein [Roseovarius aestuarii]
MTLRWNPAVGFGLTLAAVFLFAVLMVFSMFRMFEVENAMRVNAEHNMLWVLHKGEVAALRMAETMALAENNATDQDQISLRFDILLSRIALLNDGPQRRFVEGIGLAKELDDLTLTLEEIQPLIDKFKPADGPRLRATLEPVPRLFGRAANAAMIADWDELGGRLEVYRSHLRQTIASLIGIMLAGGILTVALFLSLRQSRRDNSMLRRERDFSGLLISSSGEGILAVDRTGRCTLWNDAMEKLMGKSAQQAVGRPLRNVAGFFDISPVREGIARALHGHTEHLTLQPLFQPHRDIPLRVDLRFFPLRNDDETLGAILFLNDATDRYKALQKDAQDRDRLEELVSERTRDLDNALQRERSAAKLYRNFAAMVSHQFRTPLAVADSALQRLIRRGTRATPEEINERATRARDAIDGLTRLVDSTMDAARLDAGLIGARRTACDLGQIVNTVCAYQRTTADGRQIVIRQPTEDPGTAFCDPAHAEQVLENLVSNAVKYAAPDTPIVVTYHSDAENLFCDVSNEGNPIPEKERAQIFVRNFRGTNSVGSKGTGVGLFIARTLARMQGGDVSLLSSAETTTFRLTLPRFYESLI